MSYVVEVDQSGKIGDTKMATALALANGMEWAILIPAAEKRVCIQRLRGEGYGERMYYLLFATALFLLLRDCIEELILVIIDEEYRGKETMILGHLLNLFRRSGRRVKAEQFAFRRITKKSPAHRVALETLRGDRRADRVITAEELLEEF
ncbi:MAG: hypothetical protein ACE5LU_00355 [Anaerolineae bacterium]